MRVENGACVIFEDNTGGNMVVRLLCMALLLFMLPMGSIFLF